MAPPVTKTATTTSAVSSAAEKPPPPSPTAAALVTPFAVGRPPDASPSDAFPSPDASPMPGASPPCFCSVGPPCCDEPPAGEIPAPNNGGFEPPTPGVASRRALSNGRAYYFPAGLSGSTCTPWGWAITSPPPPSTPSATATQVARRTWVSQDIPARVAKRARESPAITDPNQIA